MAAIITSLTTVFGAIWTWIIDAIGDMVPLFYVAETGLTFLGTLSVIGLGISIFFLIMGLIQNFLHFRG